MMNFVWKNEELCIKNDELCRALSSAAVSGGPGCDAVCVVPAPLLPGRQLSAVTGGEEEDGGMAMRVDKGWFYRVESSGGGGDSKAMRTDDGSGGEGGLQPEAVGVRALVDADKHIVWTLDKF